MDDKSKLPKDVEEQIQGLASDVYIQVEEKLTHLITAAIKAEVNNSTNLQNKSTAEQEQIFSKEISQLKQALAEKQVDEATSKQNFQVELTQNTINYTETIELLEKQLANAKQHNTQQLDDKQSSDKKLEEKLLETEQKLNVKTHDVDGLNGRIMVLTEQKQCLTNDLAQAKEQAESLSITKTKMEDSAKHQKKISELTEQITKEQDSKALLQQQLSVLQKNLDTEQDKNTKLNEQAASTKQQLLDDIKTINLANEQAKQLQGTAQQKIIELDKANQELTTQLETAKKEVELSQQEISVLNEQVKVAQEEQEKILQRFNSNREKQDQENSQVRETIKFLRDENHELTTENETKVDVLTKQINELEHKLTEYRLKFEYAQKQLAN